MTDEPKTIAEAIEHYQKRVDSGEVGIPAAETGACIYMAGSSVKCAVVSRAGCNALRGSFYPGQACP